MKPVVIRRDQAADAPNLEEIRKVPIIASLVLGAFVAILNQTLLNVAIPQLMNDFNVSANTIQWLTTAYMLTNGIIIPITAWLMATFTTRQMFLGALSCFTVGSIICAVSPGFSVMLIGRIVQAAGAGTMMPLMMTVILNLFPPETRGKAMGTIGIAMFFAPAVGPTLSGWIIQNYSWRLLFYIVIPIAVIALIVSAIFLRNVTDVTKPKFEIWSFLFSTIGLGSLLYGFSEAGNNGWGSSEVRVSLIVGVIFVAAFVWRELTSENPLLNLRVFKYGMYSLSAGVSSVLNMAMFGGALLTPIYIQNVRGYSPLDSGLLLLPGAIVMGIMSPISGALLDKIGVRPLAIFGLLITIATTWELGHLTMDTTYMHVMIVYTFRMFGMSFLMMTIMTAGLNHLPRHLNSHGTAAANTVRMVAASLGTSLLITVMSNRTTLHYAQYVNNVSSTNPQMYYTMHSMAQGLAAQLGQPLQTGMAIAQQMLYGMAMQRATVQGIDDAFLVATGIACVSFIMSLFLRRAKKAASKERQTAIHALPAPAKMNQ
ncbi:DHA2 family efflux MFS transporter permease subunit [Alicyclobacillus pomorum]|uniref:DHA2 family efflux MFS transporter permease subunit n=1 Tax=Alicyclobacillus pomorum TaxID=204470 RepID=UPI0003F98F3B|nr:DHA2 family efflux MFS transporter permease subunit [Alicyclobacillus pomorum]